MPKRSNTPWTDEEDAILARMWREGASASQIAKALETGRSRNACIGRVHRLNLPMRIEYNSNRTNAFGRVRNARTGRKPRKVIYTPVAAARVRAPTINPRKAALRAEQIETLNVPFLEVQRFQCRAIVDDTRFAQKCCGQWRDEDSPYCADHRALYSAPAKEKGQAA